MGIFSRKDERFAGAAAMAAGRSEVMSRRGHGLGFGEWLDRMGSGGSTVSGGGWSAQEMRGYRSLRACVPIVDAAVSRLVRLCGGFEVKTGDDALDRELMAWGRELSTGYGGRGVDGFLDAYLDSLLVCGRAAAEMVVGEDGRVKGVLCLDPAGLMPRVGRSALDFELCRLDRAGRAGEAIDGEKLLFSTLSPEPTAPYGVSLLRSLAGVCEKLMVIFDAIGASWGRFGSPKYAVTVRDADSLFGDDERLERIAEQWTRVMTSASGFASDFVAAGDLDVKVIGADGQEMSAAEPARLLCEQIVAKLGIPPFLLGLSWSSTERMSTQQADLLTSEIDAVRRTVTPAIEKLFGCEAAARGADEIVTVEWSNVSLQDEVELAKAELYRMQAKEIEASI